MPSSPSVGVKRAANYSNCPLKKRPIKYDASDDDDSDHYNHSKFKFYIHLNVENLKLSFHFKYFL